MQFAMHRAFAGGKAPLARTRDAFAPAVEAAHTIGLTLLG